MLSCWPGLLIWNKAFLRVALLVLSEVSSYKLPSTGMELRVIKVEIYTTPICGYCAAARRLLQKNSVNIVEIDVMRQPKKRAEMVQRTLGGRTVPQVFIADTHVGGCDELHALERMGKLHSLLFE